jgi:uncharacterized protein YkwD
MSASRFALVFGLMAACALFAPASSIPVEPGPVIQAANDLVGPAARPASSLKASAARTEPMVRKINKVRRRSGLRRLRPSRRLARSSRRFGRHLMRANRFGHDSHIWGGRRFRSVGEVLALHRGWRARRSRTIRGWMRSSGHRAVLLGRFRLVGVARVRGRFGRRRATIWVAQVAR